MARGHWAAGLMLFLGWWGLVTAMDLAGSRVAAQLGRPVPPAEALEWGPLLGLEWVKAWVAVGFAEELAFRGYLHRKLIGLTGSRWGGIALAALLFGLWHIPGGIATHGTFAVGMVASALVVAGYSFLVLHLPYAKTGLLPLVALFHGWSDLPLLVTLQPPSAIGTAVGPLLLLGAARLYSSHQARGWRGRLAGGLWSRPRSGRPSMASGRRAAEEAEASPRLVGRSVP
jgi:membrane protease YdiL (CAAX protease family)